MVAAAAIGAVGASQQAKAAGKGADAQAAASAEATAEQRRQFDITQENMAPWLREGTWALGNQRALLSGDFSSFKESPDYQFRLQQGLQGLERGAAARGRLYSGGQQADLINYNQGMASQGFSDFYNRLAGLSNTGQTTAGQLGQFGANAATQIGNNAMAAGNARASAYGQQGAAWGNYANQLGGLVNYGIQNYGGGNGNVTVSPGGRT